MRVLTNMEVWRFWTFRAVPANAIRMADASYACVDRDFAEGSLWDYTARAFGAAGLDHWSPDWDCDDFTRAYCAMAQWSHFRAQESAGRMLAEAPALWEMWVMSMQHAIVAGVRQDEEGDLQPFYLEPQPRAAMKRLELSQEDLLSVSLIR